MQLHNLSNDSLDLLPKIEDVLKVKLDQGNLQDRLLHGR